MALDLGSVPWLLILVALGPILLFLPLLAELLKRRDVGPRPLPAAGPEASPDVLPVGDPVNPDPTVVHVDGSLQARGRGILNHLVVRGHIALPAGVTVEGTIKATEQVELGDGATVKGDILAGGNVVLGALARVEGIIDSGGAVILRRGSGAQAIIAKGGTTLADGVEVTKRVVSGQPIKIEGPADEAPLPPPPAQVQAPSPEPTRTNPTVPSRGALTPQGALAEIEALERDLESLGAQGTLEAPFVAEAEVPEPAPMLIPAPIEPAPEPPATVRASVPRARSDVAAPRVATLEMPLHRPRSTEVPSPSTAPTRGMVMKFPGGARRVQHS